MVDPAEVTDRSRARRSSWRTCSTTTQSDIEQAIVDSATGPVPVAGYIGDKKDEDPEADRRRDAARRQASATARPWPSPQPTGVDLPRRRRRWPARLRRRPATPVTGLALAERGPDQPTIYAAAGDKVVTVAHPERRRDRHARRLVAMPNNVEKVYLGRGDDQRPRPGHDPGRQRRRRSTSIEPRGNSVSSPTRRCRSSRRSRVMDAQHDYPAEDRNDLLAHQPAAASSRPSTRATTSSPIASRACCSAR